MEKLRADLQKLTPKAAAAEKEKEAVKNALLEVCCALRVLGVLRSRRGTLRCDHYATGREILMQVACVPSRFHNRRHTASAMTSCSWRSLST